MLLQEKLRYTALFKQQGFINGRWCDAIDSNTVDVINPADEAVIGTIAYMQSQEAEAAISAAESAYPKWRALTAKERSIILRRWYELILQHQEDLALIMTTEQGKPLAEARSEILYAASFVEWFAEEAKRVYGDIIPSPLVGRKILVQKEPVGVVAAITPWNFPAAMITRKIAPALAAGCTVVVKPAIETPYSALALAALAEEAGFPAGVLNIVTGKAEQIGSAFTSSSIVRKLSFTGSTSVGKMLLSACAATVKNVSMELGGNAPFIIFNDADIDAALEGLMVSKYRNSGQTCICANRILVQDKVYDDFVSRLTVATHALRIGNGVEEDVQQGPLITEEAVEKAERLLDDAVKKGAKITTGGCRAEGEGYFFTPTVVTNITKEMHITKEEIFAPIAAVIRFSTEKEAIQIANNTDSGLAAYFYTQDSSQIERVSSALEYGMIGINAAMISTEVAPFGGMKQSGIGREGSHYGIEEYLEVKYLCCGC